MEGFQLQFPWVLALLLPLAAFIFRQLSKREPSVAIPSLDRVPAKRVRKISVAKSVPAAFYAVAGTLLIFALAGPRFDAGEIRQKSEGIDIILAIDLSDSMAAFDPSKNLQTDDAIRRAHESGETQRRIEVCKEEIEQFIKARPDDRIGLIAFADLPYAVCPPTLDHAWLLKQVASLKLHSIGEGTGLAAPIISVVDRTKNSEAERKVMVLFTDGSNTVQNKVTPEQAAKIAADYKLAVHTVGIGSRRAYIDQRSLFGTQLIPYPNGFDEALLKKIAQTTGGRYYAADDREAMREALAEIDRLEKTTRETPRIALFDERADSFAGAALAFLLIGFALSRTVFLRFP